MNIATRPTKHEPQGCIRCGTIIGRGFNNPAGARVIDRKGRKGWHCEFCVSDLGPKDPLPESFTPASVFQSKWWKDNYGNLC